MAVKSHSITYSLSKGQASAGFLITLSDAVMGFAFSDPIGRLTFFSFDVRLKDLEKMVFRSIEEIEGSVMTFMDGRAGDARPAPAKTTEF